LGSRVALRKESGKKIKARWWGALLDRVMVMRRGGREWRWEEW